NMVADHCKRRRRDPQALPEKFPEPAAPAQADLDQLFHESWRDELLAKTWQALEEWERDNGQPFHTVLRFRADHPQLRSADLAIQLGEKMAKPLTAPAVRQLVHRSREKFAEFLKAEVLDSIRSDDPEEFERELQDLGLAGYLR